MNKKAVLLSIALLFESVFVMSPSCYAKNSMAAPQGTVRFTEAATTTQPTLFTTENRAFNHFEFTIPKETTLIRVPDDPILNAVYNTAKLEVFSNAKTHALFVKPLTDDVTTLYLTTKSGVTLSLALTPDEYAPERPILLRAKTKPVEPSPVERAPDFSRLSPLAAPDYSSKLSRFVKQALNQETGNELECTPLKKTDNNRLLLEVKETLKPLHVMPLSRCASKEALGLVVSVTNGTLGTWQLHNEALLGLKMAPIMGVASTQETLKPTDVGQVVFLISPTQTDAITFKKEAPKHGAKVTHD